MAEKGIDYLTGPTKRRLDKVGAAALGLGLAPLGVWTAAGVMLDTNSLNPFFTQERNGQGGRFKALKLRSLPKRPASEELQVFGTFDPRASKFGQFIRQTGLDELPQLGNVLKGDMSLVGVRPMTDRALQLLEQADPKLFEDWYGYFRQVRPGLMGPSQIYRHGFEETTAAIRCESMRLDIDYLETATLGRDLRIICATPRDLFAANHNTVPTPEDRLLAA